MAEHGMEYRGGARAGMSAEATVIRGQQSWTFFYVFAGFVLAIEGTMVSMVEPLPWWGRELLFVVVAAASLWLILFNARVQDRLLAWKTRYESKPR